MTAELPGFYESPHHKIPLNGTSISCFILSAVNNSLESSSGRSVNILRKLNYVVCLLSLFIHLICCTACRTVFLQHINIT